MPNNAFNLENQYQMYLKLVGLKESLMPQRQRESVKRAFMGGIGQLLVLMGDIAELDDGKAEQTMQGISDQVQHFFVNESAKMN